MGRPENDRLAAELLRAAAEIEHLREYHLPGFLGAVDRFYAPLDELLTRVRAGDADAIEPALRFLEVDPRCFRSGYFKADLLHALAHAPDLAAARQRVQQVVAPRLLQCEPRLWRHTVRLAAAVWDDAFEARVAAMFTEAHAPEASIDELRATIRHLRESDAGRGVAPRSGP